MFSKNITLTEEQQIGVDQCVDFIRNGNHEQYFTLSGKAGTGKSTIIRKVLGRFRQNNIIIGALSHKAKSVITESVKQDSIKCNSLTIASMLGMTLDQETGKFVREWYNKKLPPISEAEIVVIDEASMVSEEALKLIFQYKPYGCKILFLGDRGQLHPIREENSDNLSPIFDSPNKALLTTRIRQSADHPVLEFADHYWNNSQQEFPVEYPVPQECRVNKIQGDNKLLFFETMNEIKGVLLEKFKEAVDTNNPNRIKIVTYRNVTRKAINSYFHSALFKKEDGTLSEYNIGELIIFNDNYNAEGDNLIDNSSEFQIKRVLRHTMHIKGGKELTVFGLEIDVHDYFNDRITVMIKVLAEESKEDYNKYVSSLFTLAKGFPDKSKERKKALKEAWDAKNKYANIDYAYSITSHKSQGSTYDTVVVHESDIMLTPVISSCAKSRSIYTALTRARYEVYVV